jgi:hypothetical protein
MLNARLKKVCVKCHETNLGYYLFHIGIIVKIEVFELIQ